MIERKRHIEITIEHEEKISIRGIRRSGQQHCPECGRTVNLISVEEAMAVSGAGSRTIHRWVEQGRVHFTETPNGFLVICLNSLPK